MTKKRHRTEAEYEELARSYATEPIRADEVRSVEIGPAPGWAAQPKAPAPAKHRH